MVKLVLGIAAPVGASTLYSLGVALQAMDAREVPHGHHLRVSLVRQLVVRARWLVGTGMSILGWPLHVVALLLAPLVVVQPALAAGLLVLMLVGQRLLDEPAGRREYLAMTAIVVAVAAVGATAPHRHTGHAGDLVLTLVLIGLGLADAAPLRPAHARAFPTHGHDGWRRTGLRVERRGDEARLTTFLSTICSWRQCGRYRPLPRRRWAPSAR
jgi:hypothetical protein